MCKGCKRKLQIERGTSSDVPGQASCQLWPPTRDAEIKVLGQLPGSCRVAAEGLPRALVRRQPAQRAAVGGSPGGGGPGRAEVSAKGISVCCADTRRLCWERLSDSKGPSMDRSEQLTLLG